MWYLIVFGKPRVKAQTFRSQAAAFKAKAKYEKLGYIASVRCKYVRET